MYLQRYYLECLSQASYMVADEESRIAAVIDPRRDVAIYLEDAREQGFTIKHVILTHFHADFVAGHIELRDQAEAQIYLGARAEAEFAFQPLGDGSTIEMGQVRLAAIETPGHTPEAITLLAYDLKTDPNQPYAMFTGDTLFLGDVGRPDLLASIGHTADELAEMLYDSLHRKLADLPGATLVYPAHGAGSMCGKALSDEAVSTLEAQRRYNYALQPMSKADFKKLVTADQPEAPAYFVHDAMLNRQNRPALEEAVKQSLKPLALDAVLALQTSGAQILDVRPAKDYAAAHLRGAINIGIDGRFASWAGSLLDKDKQIVIVAEANEAEEAIIRLGRIGYHQISGYLKEGMTALNDRPDFIAKTRRITAAEWQEQDGESAIVDVRTENEWQSGHIAGSRNIPLTHLRERIAELPAEGDVLLHCQGGYRSMIAVSLLENAGRENAIDLIGGYAAWAALQPKA